MEKIIVVDHTEILTGAKGDYLKVHSKDGKFQNIFDQALWSLFSDGLAVKLQLEKQGNWWNVTGAEGVSEKIDERVAEAGIAPQERGMCLKEIGEGIRTGQIAKDFPKSEEYIKQQYYTSISKGSGINFIKKESTE